jgi:ABC-type Fe3+-siderophore transport system permease subunit
MQLVLIILSAGLLGLIIYFAFSPKSSRTLKLSALVALGLIALTVGICSVFLIKGPADNTEEILLPIFQETASSPKKDNAPIFIFLIILALILGLILFLAFRDQRLRAAAPGKGKASVFSKIGGFGAKEQGGKRQESKKSEENFDLDL